MEPREKVECPGQGVWSRCTGPGVRVLGTRGACRQSLCLEPREMGGTGQGQLMKGLVCMPMR